MISRKKFFIFISFFEIDNLPHAIEKGHAILVAESNFNAENEGDLSIQKGDLIIGLETVDQAWTKGRNLQGQVGIFPTSFCWSADSDLLFKNKSKVGGSSVCYAMPLACLRMHFYYNIY